GQSRQAAQLLASALLESPDDGGAADLQPEALPEALGRLLTSALGGDQRLDALFETVVLEAPRARLEVLAQPLFGLRGAFTVEQGPYLCDHFRTPDAAVGIIVGARLSWAGKLAHDDTSSCA